MAEEVYINHRSNVKYSDDGIYHPHIRYPEYPFGEQAISSEENDSYDMVRSCLLGLGLDKENAGTEHWNPLGKYLRSGDTVVIKPNLVMHKNENTDIDGDGLECLITNPSCIRAICDYCIIALRGSGRIIIGDAPMQACRFQELLDKTRLPEVLEFYKRQGFDNVSVQDFREYGAIVNRNAVLVDRSYTDAQAVTVNLNEKSQHAVSMSNGEYQVSDYDIVDTKRYHHGSTHQYVVSKDVLQADLLINFCKPKTHRLAGFTGAMKNMVGITYNKSCLPHRTSGSVQEGGDAYQHKNACKRAADWALTQKIRQENKHHIVAATVLRYMYGAFLIAGRVFGKDPYFIGSWYGNDTIWRTVCDLNYIVTYADENGSLHDEPQRHMLCLGDMLTAGEGNGPVKPTPKPMGVMIAAENPVTFDLTLCQIMGFDSSFIPLVRNIEDGNTRFSSVDPIVIWDEDGKNHCQKPLSEMVFPKAWTFRPHSAWIKDVQKN